MNLLLSSCLLIALVLSCHAASACGYDHNKEQEQSLENLYSIWQAQRLGRVPYDHQLIRKSSAGPLRLRFGKRTLGDRLADLLAERRAAGEGYDADGLPKSV